MMQPALESKWMTNVCFNFREVGQNEWPAAHWAHLEAVRQCPFICDPWERLTDRRKQRHTDEEEDTPEHIAVHLPLKLAAFVTRPAVVQQSLGFMACAGSKRDVINRCPAAKWPHAPAHGPKHSAAVRSYLQDRLSQNHRVWNESQNVTIMEK